MKRTILTAVLSVTAVIAASVPLQCRSLTFNSNGEFKIMQLTDLHLKGNFPSECSRVYDRISYMVGEEHPDFIVITGDIVYSKPARPVIAELTSHLDSFGIPWAVVFGNHDAEQDLSRKELSTLYASGRNSLNTLGSNGELADLEIPLVSGSGTDALYCLYLLDSHDYSSIEGLNGYGWFSAAQIQWMRSCCSVRKMPDGRPVPALAFFHIPLREYIDAWALQYISISIV